MIYFPFSIKVRRSMRPYECALGDDCNILKNTHYFIISINMYNLDRNYPKEIKICKDHTLDEVVEFLKDDKVILECLRKEKKKRQEEKIRKHKERNRPFNRFDYLDLD